MARYGAPWRVARCGARAARGPRPPPVVSATTTERKLRDAPASVSLIAAE
ncbi:hypothetical protein I5I96_26515, partial [Pseudomonas aeruginosa]|nr:hypothetical protein [Pseudomonas aeruginosa]